MNAEMIVKLIEEMLDIKVQQQAEMQLHVRPELARLLEEKRHGDRRRLEMIKQELTRLLT
jgi:flagellar biosynthesis/type III secretory pathway protein FliH